jgi:hypothetical protein
METFERGKDGEGYREEEFTVVLTCVSVCVCAGWCMQCVSVCVSAWSMLYTSRSPVNQLFVQDYKMYRAVWSCSIE